MAAMSDTPSQKIALVVMGAHRSGTSAMSGVLGISGGVMPAKLMQPSSDNPKGFWEPVDIVRLSDTLMAALDSGWDDVFAGVQSRYLSNVEGALFEEAVQAIAQNYGGATPIVLKDPRVSVLNDFWRRVLITAGYDPRYVIMVRNPIEAADSLVSRNGFSREKAVLLWANYLIAAERDTRDLPRVFIRYDGLLDDWRSVLDVIETSLDVVLPRRTSTASIELGRFLERSLRHQRLEQEASDRAISWQPAKRLHQLLLRLSDGVEVSPDEFDKIGAELAKLSDVVGPIIAEAKLNLAASESVTTANLQSQMERAALAEARSLQLQHRQETDALKMDGLHSELRQLVEREQSLAQQLRLQEQTATERVDGLTRKLAALEEEDQRRRSEVASLSENVEVLTVELNKAKGRLQTEEERRALDLSESRTSLKAATDKVSSLSADLERALLAQDHLTLQLKEAQNQLHEAKAGLEAELAANSELNARLGAEAAIGSEIKAKLESRTFELNETRGRLHAASSQLSTLSASYEAALTARDDVILREREQAAILTDALARLDAESATNAALLVTRDELLLRGREQEAILTDALARLDAESAASAALLAERDNFALRLESQSTELSTTSKQLYAEKAERSSLKGQILVSNAEVQSLTQQLQAEIRENNASAILLKESRERAAAEAAELARGLQTQRTLLADVVSERDQLRRARDEVLASTSWRLTQPIRVFARAVRPKPSSAPSRSSVEGASLAIYRRLPLGRRAKLALMGALLTITPDFVARGRVEYWKKHYRERQARIARIQARTKSIVFQSHDKPAVSVIIPNYGNPEMVLTCLKSLEQTASDLTVEYILREDASGDPDVGLLKAIRGLKYSENLDNLGFIGTCNAAAATAAGKYLVFLNSDTVVRSGWLDALIDLAKARSDAGIVGSKLVYPDGSLQEAGGIFWTDGSAWNFGNRDTADRSIYNYVREVDYVSGASLLIEKDLFDQLDGFDEEFKPAYCEDSDLAFRVRAAGKKVYYQPRSVVEHHEGGSNGTDLGAGVKAYQVVNSEKLFRRWKHTLAVENFENGQSIFLAKDRGRARKTVLVIDHYVPKPDQDAGSRTIFAFLRCLVADGWLVKFWPENLHDDQIYAPALYELGIEVFTGPAYIERALWFEEHLGYFDAVLASRPHVTEPILDLLTRPGAPPIIFYGHDVHHLRMEAQMQIDPESTDRNEINHVRSMEETVWRAADVVLYPSDSETTYVKRQMPDVDARTITPYAYPQRRTPAGPANRKGLVFVAGFAHSPNVDAAKWLVSEIMPIVWRAFPEVALSLVGSHPTDDVQALASERVFVTGWVSDSELERYYDMSRVAVVPLRFGAGIKSKVVEAMHAGLPLVTTSVGIQGLHNAERVVEVHDVADSFAQAVTRLLRDDRDWQGRSTTAAAYVAEKFGQSTMQTQLSEAINGAIGARRLKRAAD